MLAYDERGAQWRDGGGGRAYDDNGNGAYELSDVTQLAHGIGLTRALEAYGAAWRYQMC